MLGAGGPAGPAELDGRLKNDVNPPPFAPKKPVLYWPQAARSGGPSSLRV